MWNSIRRVGMMGFVCVASGVWGQPVDTPKPAIKAAIKAGSKGEIIFTVTALQNDVKLYLDNNSWGYENRWFVATDPRHPSQMYRLERQPIGWRANAPITVTLKKGDSHEFIITLCQPSDTWEMHPPLSSGTAIKLRIKGIYENKDPGPSGVMAGLSAWVGKVETPSITLTLDAACLEKLKGPVPR